MRVSVLTLGCKVNKYESDSILQEFKNLGYDISDKLEFADIYIVNTCAVTSEAERKSRQMIAWCRRFNPSAKIIVCGCASQNNLKQFEGKNIHLLSGTNDKHKLVSNLEKGGILLSDFSENFQEMPFSHQSRTRAYIKIQDGCNNFCTYCIIPYLRGRSRSRSIESIIKEAQSLSDEVKEIVLTGINVADYKIEGTDGLIDLLERLDGLGKRLRLSSLEDGVIDQNMLERLSKLQNFCPHFHLSLQSGCDSVLKRMNRHYTSSEFANSVNQIRKFFPNAGITTDVIVGFPGESEEEFKSTVEFVKKVKFSYLHIFPYSKREGTVAAKMQDLPFEVKKERAKILEEVNKQLQADFISKNSNLNVLIEEICDGYAVGHSKNFIKCYIPNEDFKVGDILNVKICKRYKDGVIAKKL